MHSVFPSFFQNVSWLATFFHIPLQKYEVPARMFRFVEGTVLDSTETAFFSFVLQFFQFLLLKRIRNFSFKYQIPLKSSYALFIVYNTFVSNTSLKFAKVQATSKQLLEAELLLFENSLVSSTRYHPKIGHILNKV